MCTNKISMAGLTRTPRHSIAKAFFWDSQHQKAHIYFSLEAAKSQADLKGILQFMEAGVCSSSTCAEKGGGGDWRGRGKAASVNVLIIPAAPFAVQKWCMALISCNRHEDPMRGVRLKNHSRLPSGLWSPARNWTSGFWFQAASTAQSLMEAILHPGWAACSTIAPRGILQCKILTSYRNSKWPFHAVPENSCSCQDLENISNSSITVSN